MTYRAAAAALAAVLLACLLVPASAQAKRVRVFAVGPKIDQSWLQDRATFRAKLLALTDRELRDAAGVRVQSGADDVSSHLLGPADASRPVQTARDLIAMPEDLGLLAAFTGQQGVTARSASDITTAILGLLGTYAPQSAYYQSRFPALASRPFPPTRLLAVALTDTFAHVAVETFAEIADRSDAYLVAGVNMARDWQVVCVSRASYTPPPGGEPCAEENPGKVAALRAPEDVTRTYAYEATAPDPVNMALIFDPQGRIVSKQVKAYLTPVELPGSLDLKPGAVSGLGAVPTPVGRIGVVTSKDAWMPDVTAKLDQDRAEILVQPEFFVGDTVRRDGPWAPDTIKASGYADVLRHPAIQTLVLPELTGNLFDFSADNQQAIMLKPRSRKDPGGALLGQERQPGLVAVSPWVVPDPVRAGEPLVERRARLAAAGEALLPGSGVACADPSVAAPCENGHVESVLFADVQVADPRPLRPVRRKRRAKGRVFTADVPVARSRSAQRNVSLAARGTAAWAAFEEQRAGRDQIALVRSTTEGARWSRRVRPTGRPAGAAREWWPALSVGADGTLWAVWQDDSSGTWRVYVARSTDGGRTFTAPRALGADAPDGVQQWRPAIAATGAGTAVAAWVDERGRFSGDDLPRAEVRVARIEGDRVLPDTRLDGSPPPVPLAATLDHAWAPTVAARGAQVTVAWLDFRSYDWRTVVRESVDGGVQFEEPRVITRAPDDVEALDDTPRAVHPTGGGPAVVAHTRWAKESRGGTVASRQYDVVAAAGDRSPVQVDGRGGGATSAFAPAVAAVPGGDVLIAFQDHATGPGHIYVSRLDPSVGRVRRPRRVDDTGGAGANQWRPAVAVSRGRVLVAWEDERDGPSQIYVARAAPGRVR